MKRLEFWRSMGWSEDRAAGGKGGSLGMPALAITDLPTFCGLVKFYGSGSWRGH